MASKVTIPLSIKYFIIINIILFISYNIKSIYVNSGKVYISNEDDFIEAFKKNDTIFVTKSIVIDDDIFIISSPSKVAVYGLDKSISVTFNNGKGMNFINIDFVEFKNITIIGKLYYDHENMNYCGLFNTTNQYKGYYQNYYKNFSYINCNIPLPRENVMDFYSGTYTFNNCSFYGINEVKDSFIKLSGNEKDFLEFNYCTFNGNYKTSSIIGNGCKVLINNCEFINNFNKDKG